MVEAMNRSGKPILALDLPSGLDADTGVPLGVAVQARATATFVAPKLGFSVPGGGGLHGRSRGDRYRPAAMLAGTVRAMTIASPHPSRGSVQYFGTNFARSSYLGLWCHSLSLTLKPRSSSSWARSAQGVLGCLAMTSLSSRLASAYFLAVSSLGAWGFLAWSTTQVIARSGVGSLLGRGGLLDDLGHQGAVLVGLDLEGDDLGEHQVVVGLPALLGLAVAELGESPPAASGSRAGRSA